MKNVYVVLTQTGTLVSSIIRRYTKDPYNHASIAFDRSLDVMYSFGRKHRYNILNNGFIEENFNKGLFAAFPNARCLVLEIAVTEEQYETMLEAVGAFLCHKEKYRYNMIGLLGYMVGIGLARRDHFFCSQFVAYVLGKAEVWHGVPGLTKPIDFLTIPQRTVIFEGSIKEYLLLHEVPASKQRKPPAYKCVLSLLKYLMGKIRGALP